MPALRQDYGNLASASTTVPIASFSVRAFRIVTLLGEFMPKIAYQGWASCYRLASGHLELIATGDVGPRIIHLSAPGGENLFAVLPEHAGLTGGDEWRIYGGHRLWHAPQARPRSELPDNEPVKVLEAGHTLCLTQPVEAASGIQKEITVTLDPNRPHAVVRHRLSNLGLWPVELAPWAISAMAGEGVAIAPQSAPPAANGCRPDRLLALWPFADAADPRLRRGHRYLLLYQHPANENPFKVGLNVTEGWVAYYRRGSLFVKCFEYQEAATYPDMGSSVELFDCALFLEVETLGPLVRLAPGSSVEHVEHWFVYDGVAPVHDEDAAQRIVCPLAEESLRFAGLR